MDGRGFRCFESLKTGQILWGRNDSEQSNPIMANDIKMWDASSTRIIPWAFWCYGAHKIIRNDQKTRVSCYYWCFVVVLVWEFVSHNHQLMELILFHNVKINGKDLDWREVTHISLSKRLKDWQLCNFVNLNRRLKTNLSNKDTTSSPTVSGSL